MCTFANLVTHVSLEPVETRAQLVHLVLEPKHRLDAGQVETELGRQPLDNAQARDVALGVQARVACRPLGADEALRLVDPKCLRRCMPTSSAATLIM